MTGFNLTEGFLSHYKNKKPKFGFNGLGELVYNRTYSTTCLHQHVLLALLPG